jgi:hypothetical protein
MANLIDLRLLGTAQRIQVRYPLAAGLTVLLPALATLLLLGLVARHLPHAEDPLPLAIGLWLGLTSCELARLLWWSTVTFDRERGVILRGSQFVARLEHLVGIEQAQGLVLVFQPDRTPIRRWSLPAMSATEAQNLGAPLAERLGVPLVARIPRVSTPAS